MLTDERRRKKTHIELNLRDLRALESIRGKWVADLERPRFLREALEELVVDTFLDEDTRSRTARLTMVPAKCHMSVYSILSHKRLRTIYRMQPN